MPAKDSYHDVVVQSLTDEGWTITHDPLQLTFGEQDLYVDLGAEQGAIGAEKGGRKIAVEIKSFMSRSAVNDFEHAVGQYIIYRDVLELMEPDRVLWLAVPERVWESFLAQRFGQLILQKSQIRLIVFNAKTARILKWIS